MKRFYSLYHSIFVIVLSMVIGLLTSCEEVGPTIETELPDEEIITLSQIPSPAEKHMLLFEFSGGNCSNCPNGALAVEELKANYGDKIIAVTGHMLDDNNLLAFPAEGASQDFRLLENKELFYGFQGTGIPSAGLDFVHFTNENNTLLTPTKWPIYVPTLLAETSPILITSSATIEQDSIQAEVHIDYSSAVSEAHNIVALIVEDHIIDHQVMPNLSLNENYEHRHIIRDFITIAYGSPLAPDMSEKPAGTRIIRRFTSPLLNTWDTSHLYLIVYIVNVNSNEVYQASEIPIP
jgi:hypothetical protein